VISLAIFTDVCNFVAFTANYSINHICNLHYIQSLHFDTVKPHNPGWLTGPKSLLFPHAEDLRFHADTTNVVLARYIKCRS
jgi:hypothetical protein